MSEGVSTDLSTKHFLSSIRKDEGNLVTMDEAEVVLKREGMMTSCYSNDSTIDSSVGVSSSSVIIGEDSFATTLEIHEEVSKISSHVPMKSEVTVSQITETATSIVEEILGCKIGTTGKEL